MATAVAFGAISPIAAMARYEAAVELGHGDEAERVGAEVPAEMLRRHAEILDEHERRGGEIRKKAAQRGDKDQRGPEEADVAANRQQARERMAERRAAPLRGVRLLQVRDHQNDAQGGESSEEP